MSKIRFFFKRCTIGVKKTRVTKINTNFLLVKKIFKGPTNVCNSFSRLKKKSATRKYHVKTVLENKRRLR